MRKTVYFNFFLVILCIYLTFLAGCNSTPSDIQNSKNNLIGTYAYNSSNIITFDENILLLQRGSRTFVGTYVLENNQLVLNMEDGNILNWRIINNRRISDHSGYTWNRLSNERHRQIIDRHYRNEQRIQQEAEQRQRDHEAMLRQRGITEEQWQAEEAERRRREAQSRREQEALSQLIQNLLDVGVNVGQPFRNGDIVAIPLGLFRIIDVSSIGGIHSYLVIMNDSRTPTIPFYIETSKHLSSGIGPMRIEYLGSAQYMHGRTTRNTLRFREVR